MTVAYTKPASAPFLQDFAGNDLATFDARTVDNLSQPAPASLCATTPARKTLADARLLTLDRDGLPQALPDGVIAETACEWMLNDGVRS